MNVRGSGFTDPVGNPCAEKPGIIVGGKEHQAVLLGEHG